MISLFKRFIHLIFLFELLLSNDNTMAQNKNNLIATYFSHCFLVLDTNTFRAIETSSFLRDSFAFAPIITSTVNGGKQSYTGLYLFGCQTYLEMFKSEKKQPVGACGIGLQVEKPGGLKILVDSFKKYLNLSYDSRSRKANDGIEYLYAYKTDLYGNEKNMEQLFSSWIMEFDTSFMRSKFTLKYHNDITRETFQQNRFRKDLYLKDVKKLIVYLPETDKQSFINIASRMHAIIIRNHRGIIISYDNFEMEIRKASKTKKGIRSIEMSLNRQKKGQMDYHFAKSSLHFKKNLAIWHFG